MSTPLINGVAYAWADITAEFLGRISRGITAVKYEVKQEKTNNYGAGTEPVSRGRGKKEYSCSITLPMIEVEGIQAALGPGKDLTDVPPFPVNVAFINPSNRLVKHTIQMCEFTNNKRDVKTGDTDIQIELELIPGGILWQ